MKIARIWPLIIMLFSVIYLLGLAQLYSQTRVRGYLRKNGTYVQPHWRSSPNHTKLDNWTTRGNVNPFTGRKGHQNPFAIPMRHKKLS